MSDADSHCFSVSTDERLVCVDRKDYDNLVAWSYVLIALVVIGLAVIIGYPYGKNKK